MGQGIPRGDKEDLTAKYPRPSNFELLVVPDINPEVRVLLDEASLKGDNFLRKLQEQVVVGLSAMAIPLNTMFFNPTAEFNVWLEPLVDSAKVLLNVHHSLSLHRMYLLLPKLNAHTRKVVENTPVGKLLFGEDLTEKVKSIQSVRKASLELQPQTNKGPGPNTFRRGPSQSTQLPKNSKRHYPPSRYKSRGERDHRFMPQHSQHRRRVHPPPDQEQARQRFKRRRP